MSFKSIGQVAAYKPLHRCNMEELAAHYGHSYDPGGGVLFARKADGEEKAKARQLILDHFSVEKWPNRLNMLTMPSVSWRFERQLLAAREPGWLRRSKPRTVHFTSVENDRAIYYAGASQMPGTETPNALIWPVKKGKFNFAEMGLKTRYASFFFANVDDFISHEFTLDPYREGSRVGWDAAWLDYTGPLTVERLRAISKFYERFISDTLIVTVLKARWNKDTGRAILKAGGHSAWLNSHLPGDVLHDIEYFDTSPMAQFAVRKPSKVEA